MDAPVLKHSFRSHEFDPKSDYFYFLGFSHQFAATVLPFTDDIDFEIWRIDLNVDRFMAKEVGGTIGRIYPGTHLKFLSSVFSLKFLIDLFDQRRKHQLIICFSGLHNTFFLLVSALFRKTPIVAYQLGGANPLWKFKNKKKKKTWLFLQAEMIFSQYYNYVYLSSKEEFKYYSMILSKDNLIYGPTIPITEDYLKIIDRTQARLLTGLPQDKKIILAVGRAGIEAGADIIIDLYDKFIKDGYYLYWIGLYESDELFNRIKDKNIPHEGRILFKDIYKYYNAADVYLYPPLGDETLAFGGTGYQSLESLFCGTPVVSSTMISFTGDIDPLVCKVPTCLEEIYPMTIDLIINPPERMRCRDMLKDMYTKENIGHVQLEIINKLFSESGR